MRSSRTWAMQAVLLLGLGTAIVQGADRDDRAPKAPTEPESKWGWMNPRSWFSPKEKEKPADTKSKRAGKKDAAAKADAPALPSAADEARTRRAREEADLLRRLMVCDELRAVAQRKDDAAMLRQVEEMERRAFALYSQRSGARTPGTGMDVSTTDTVRDGEALLRRRTGEDPVYSVTSDRAKKRDGVKEVDR